MMRPQNGTLGGIAVELCGRGELIKNGPSAREWVSVYWLIGTLRICASGVPKIPVHLTLYARACNQMELCEPGVDLRSPGVRISMSTRMERSFLHSARDSIANMCALTNATLHEGPSSPSK